MKEEQRELYELIIRQLQSDDHAVAASNLSATTQIYTPGKGGAPHLAKLVALGKQKQLELDSNVSVPGLTALTESRTAEVIAAEGGCLDFQAEGTGQLLARKRYANFRNPFVTAHKNTCRVAAFNENGNLVATGSSDTSIKLLDVEKMRAHSQTKSEATDNDDLFQSKPVLRTFYDHAQPVNDLTFHPNSTLLVSGSRDCTIKFFDLKTQAKRASRYLQETHNVRSVTFHPSGDFILAGTDHHVIRLYDISTFQCFCASNPLDHHIAAVNQVRYAPQANVYASCSKDASVKLWDGITNECVRTMPNAHGGADICSVQFSKNQKYLLTSGKDATIRLWELTTGRQLSCITIGLQHKYHSQATFSWNEDYIICGDERNITVSVWDSRTCEQLQQLPGHTNIVRWVAPSPVEDEFITCCNDNRARFWCAS